MQQRALVELRLECQRVVLHQILDRLRRGVVALGAQCLQQTLEKGVARCRCQQTLLIEWQRQKPDYRIRSGSRPA